MVSMEQRAADLFEALFCHGQEPQCWFSRAGLAAAIGISVHDLDLSLRWLVDHGKVTVTGRAESTYARQVNQVLQRRPINTDRSLPKGRS